MTHTHNFNTFPKVYNSGKSGKSIIDELDLQDGECICDVCKGTGIDPEKAEGIWIGGNFCPKCQGMKKLDWVSRITGVPPFVDGMASSSGGVLCQSGSSLYTTLPNHTHSIHLGQVMSVSSENIEIDGKKFDKYLEDQVEIKIRSELNIIRLIKNTKEQIINKWRKFFDNRIFSKFMFFSNFKQRIKN